jgi:hypothetical protein
MITVFQTLPGKNAGIWVHKPFLVLSFAPGHHKDF